MSKRLLQLALLLVGLAWCVPAHATWTLVQVKDNTACTSGTTCAVTVTSTGANNLLVAAVQNFGTISISSVTAAACSTTWTHVTNGQVFVSGVGSVDMYYCLKSNSGQTSITITTGGFATNGVGIIWEASSSLGTIAVDSGATPSGNVTDATCTSCAGVSLTLSGNNDFTAAVAGCGGTCSAASGTGWTNDLSNPNGNGIAHGLNTTGNITAPATWTQTSGQLVSAAIALQESSGGGGAASGVSKLRKLERLGVIDSE